MVSYPNDRSIYKTGYNNGVAGTEVDIRSDDADLTYSTTAQALEIVSSSAADDNIATGTLTLAGCVPLTAATGTITLASAVANTFATGTITAASVQAADTVTINGLVYTAVAGAKANNTEFSIDTGDNECAADLAASINADVRAGTSGDISASAASAVVTVTTTISGASGNAITLVSSNGTRLAVSGAGTLTGGVTADTATVNGLVYTAVAGAKANNTQFSIDTSNTAAATDLAASITADSRSGTLNDVTATSLNAVVTCTQTVGGTGGNATTLASSSEATRLVISGATFTGGLAADVATVNGLTYTGVAGARANNTQFSTDGDDTANATDLAAAINADTRTPVTVPTVDVIATSAAGVVTVNAATAGTSGNTIDISGTSNITASAATLTDVSTGARTVLVEGLDGDYDEISETVNLNGTIAVDLVNTYLRVNNMSVVTAGTGLTNAGTITLRLDGAGATQAVIPAGDSVAHFSNYTIPARYSGEIVLIDCDIDKSGDNDVRLKTRDNGVTGAVWKTERVIRVTEDTSPQIFSNDELIFNEKTDIRFTSIRVTGADDDRISCNYTLVLHRQF